MYYRLKQSYVLRGWEGLAWVLVKRPCNQIYQLSQEEFQVLILCDGETELSRVYLKTQNCTKRQEKDIKGFYHRQYKEVIA